MARQEILAPESVMLDLEPVATVAQDLPARIAELLGRGFDVTTSVPIRAALFMIDPTEHVLVLAVHHISGDGFSTAPLARDVFTAYTARRAGSAPGWTPLAVQYADYALWQRQVLGEESDRDSTAARQLDYWRTHLAGLDDVLSLPTDRPRPAVASYRGAAVSFSVDAETTAAARSLATQQGVSVFMATHAAFAVLLARLSGSTDIAIGTPIAGRGDQALDDLVGMFVNTLVLRTRIEPGASFADVLAQVRDVDLEAFGHADIPFEQVVDALAPTRSQAHTPLFQVAIALEYATNTTELALPDITVAPVEFEPGTAQFDLVLTLGENPEPTAGFVGTLRFATDLFDEFTASAIAQRYIRILDVVAHDPSVPVESIELLSQTERNLLVPVVGPPTRATTSWAGLVAVAVEANPAGVAVVWEGRSYTSAEVDAAATRLARELAERGAGPEVLVAVALPRSLASVVAIWAVAKTGAGFVPVDPGYPVERIAHMLTDSGVRLGVTASDTALPETGVKWVLLDEIDTRPGAEFDPVPVAPQHPAYVIYTSGSTGRPKGVVVTHAGLGNLAAERRSRYAIDENTRFLHHTSISFDMAVGEQISALSGAGTLVIAPAGLLGAELSEFLVHEQVSHALITPAVLATLDPAAVPDLRVLGVGGEAVSADLVAKWAPGRVMRNGYGPSEATDIATVADLHPGTAVSIGSLVHGFTALVLDSRLRPVPAGVVGELYLAGPGLARGYHHQPGLTATRFVAYPLDPGTRLYRTGDLVTTTLTDDGVQFAYLGRSDTQIKLRGNRIEPGEIEAAATAHPHVAHAVADLRDTPHGPRLALYLVPVEGHAVDTAAVRSHLVEVLPAALVPDSLTVLDALPLAPTGKIDRAALPEPIVERSTVFRAPSTETERVLAAIVGDLLGRDRVGVDESFFALGGDSIGSIQLVSRAKARGLLLAPRQVFEHQTVAALARVARPITEQQTLPELPGGGVGSMPLTPVMRLVLGRGHYERFAQVMALQLPTGITRDGILATLSVVLDHHDALRSRLTDTGLDIAAPGSVDLDAALHHVRVDPADLPVCAQRELDAATARLNPRAGAMLQFVWLDATDDSRGRLLVVAHHLVIDGVSWRILVPDLVAVWAQLDAGAVATLAPVGTSMRRWAHALTDSAATRTGELDHWQTTLVGPDPLLGHRALDPTLDTVATSGRVVVELPVEATTRLLTVPPAAFRADAVDALLAALALAVRRWRRARGIDESSVLVQFEGHGREETLAPGADLTRTVGWFTTVYPARFDLTGIGDTDTDTALKTVKEQRRAIPDNGIGYGLLRELDANTTEVLAGYAAPQISFNYHGRGASAAPELTEIAWTPAPDNLTADPDPRMPLPATIDINGGIMETPDGPRLSASIGFASELLHQSDVEELAEHWIDALIAVVSTTGSGLTPSDVPLATTTQAELDRWQHSFPRMVDVWPLAPLQQGLAFHAHLAGDATDVYTTQTVLDLAGEVDSARLLRAAHALLQRHSALRTAFIATDAGVPVQVVLADVDVRWRQVEVADDRFDDLRTAQLAERFDLSRPPLLRFVLAAVGPSRYRLIVTMHHIVLDGWSMPVLLRDLLVLYATEGDSAALPPARSYRDFLAWLAERDHAAGRQNWRTALDGLVEPTLLAGPGHVSSASVRAVRVSSSVDLTTVTGELAVTTNTVVQAAWGILLAGWLDRDDVVFGATVSGRPADLDGAEEMVGLFINTIPVRVRLAPDDTLSTLLTRLQTQQTALLDHHHVGLAEIRTGSGSAADFDTLTVFESYPVDTAALAAANDVAGMRVTDITGTDATHYPLSLTISADTALRFTLEYDTDAFTHDQIDGLAHRLLRVLDTVATQPDAPLGRLDLLVVAERDALLPIEGPPSAGFVSWAGLVAGAVEANPDGVAVVWAGRSYTYREVDAAAARLAAVLADRGAGPEVLVAVALPRSLASVVAIWAVAKTGAGLVPVDPGYPVERIARMLTDSGVRLGVTTSDTVLLDTALPDTVLSHGTLPENGQHDTGFPEVGRVDWVVLDEIDTRPGAGFAPVLVAPQHPAYVIYTSGSTGRPKGVVVTHAGLGNLAAERRSRYAIDENTRFLHHTSISFDMAVGEQVSALSGAGTLVIAPAGLLGAELSEFLVHEQVSHALITPAVLATLDPAAVPGLRMLGVGGEAVSADLVAKWAPGRVMRNGYGPSEATDIATVADLHPGTAVSIGSLVHGFTALVLDSRLRPVPVGVVGELYLAGPGLARGYHHQPGLTATRFVAHPLDPGTRLYRTGDLVTTTLTDDGVQFAYLGRSDTQIKLRGNRIEPGEIEAALTKHPHVRHAAAVAHTLDSGEIVLVAYVVPTTGRSPEPSQLRAFAAEFLPRHMLPAAVIVLDHLPISSSGKLDRKSLPAPQIADHSAYRAPTTAVERTISEIFSEVLDIANPIGLDDDFFALGGTSLSAVRVVAAVAERLDARLPLQAVLNDPTPAGIAAALLDGPSADAELEVLLPIRRDGEGPPVFFVHPIVGLSWCYAGLAGYLDDRPLYGLQTPGIREPEPPASSLSELAGRYLREIRRVAPEGPYHLVGWSLGGVLAHEIAVQLQRDGESVASLSLLDAFASLDEPEVAVEELRTTDLLAGLGITAPVDLVHGSLQSSTVEDLLAEVEGLVPTVSPEHIRRLIASAGHNAQLQREHTPAVFDGTALLFSAAQGGHGNAAAESWSGYVCAVTEHSVDSTHWQICSPDVLAVIGPIIADHFRQSETPTSAGEAER